MKRERLTFEMEPETKTALEVLAREADRPLAYVVRQLIERSLQERRAAAVAGEAA